MDASNPWGQQQAAHPAMFQQQGQPTHQQQQALLEQHHRQAAQQQSQRQAMAALSMQYGQPSSWGMSMPQQCTSAQTANPATGGATQVQQPWGTAMPQQCASAQAASHTMFGAMQAQQASAMNPPMTQQGAMTHHLPTQSTQPSGQQLLPNTSHFPMPTQTVHPLANLLVQQQQHTTPTFNMSPTPNNPQSNTTAEALSLTHLAQNMDPTARKQLIQLLASHEPTMTTVGGSTAAALQHLQQSQQSQPPPQPPSQTSQLPQTQTHVPAATTDTTAVDAPRSEQKAPPSTRTRIYSASPRRKHHHPRRSRSQRRRSRVTRSNSPTRRHRRQHRRRSSTSSRRLSKRQPLHSHRSGRRPPSSRRSRSTRHNRPGERSPPTVPVTLRSRSQLGLSTLTPHTESKWQWRRSDISPQTKRKPQPPHSTEQLSAQFLRMARQQTLQAHRSSASGHATSRQPPTPPQKRRTSTPPQRSPTPPRHTHPQRDRDEEEAEQPAPSFPRQHQQHDIPASRILPPSHKQAPTSQQRFWRAIVPKPFCQLRDAEKPRPLPYEVAAANQFAQILAELAEGSGLSVDHIQSFSRMIHEAGLQDRTDVLRTTVLDIGQGVYKVLHL